MINKYIKILILLLIIPAQIQALTTEQWIGLYLRDCKTVKKNMVCRQNLEINLGRMMAYKGLVFDNLDKYELPRWLATVPIVESSYNDKAKSNKGALGLWQIMPYNIELYKTTTKKIMNREVTIVPSSKQIRKYGYNPVTSTQIATKHLSILFMKYRGYKNTEELALMAYNAGERRINLWLAGKGQLPAETLNYYRKLMAIQHILKNMEALGVKPVKKRKIFLIEYLKSITTLEIEIERDHVGLIFKEVLG